MSSPRGIEERIDWFMEHNPSGPGMCAQHTWHSLGGNNGNPPAWGCSDANECIDKIRASGRYWNNNGDIPPRGAWVGYKYGSNGHACLSLGDGRIATTDPGNGKPVGIEDLDYPNKWGASGWDIWTDQYNGVRFDVGANMANYDYDYLEKPGGTLTVGTSYKKLDNSEWDPPHSGWENTYVYLNIKPTKWDGDIGALRMRIVRADGDTTGHEDLIIARVALDNDGKTLRHVSYWEAGDGKKTHVELECIGGLLEVQIGTRYTKKCVVLE